MSPIEQTNSLIFLILLSKYQQIAEIYSELLADLYIMLFSMGEAGLFEEKSQKGEDRELSPFGENSQNIDSDFGVWFTGKELDSDTNLFYFNARWYSPSLGRFITQDPIRDGLNWYLYCGANPMTMIDPDGLDKEYYQFLKTRFGGSFMAGNLNKYNPDLKVQFQTNWINREEYGTVPTGQLEFNVLHYPTGPVDTKAEDVIDYWESIPAQVSSHLFIDNSGLSTIMVPFGLNAYANGPDPGLTVTDFGASISSLYPGTSIIDPNIHAMSAETVTYNDWGWSMEAYTSIVKVYGEIFIAAGIQEANNETMPGHSMVANKAYGIICPLPFDNPFIVGLIHSDVNAYMQSRREGEIGFDDMLNMSSIGAIEGANDFLDQLNTIAVGANNQKSIDEIFRAKRMVNAPRRTKSND